MNKPEKLEIVEPAEGSPEELAERGEELSISEDNAAEIFCRLRRAGLLVSLLAVDADRGWQLLPVHRKGLIDEVHYALDLVVSALNGEDERRIRLSNASAA